MRIVLDIACSGGPIDASVALAKRLARRAARLAGPYVRRARRWLRAAAVAKPVLPARAVAAHEIAT